MKKITVIAMLFIMVIPVMLMARSPYDSLEDSYRYFARISHLEGQVFIERAGEEGIEDATVNMPVGEGDRIFTGENGLAEVYVGYSTYIRLNRRTKVDFNILPFENHRRLELRLVYGDIFIRTFDSRIKIFLEARDAEFMPIEKGLYRVTYDRGELRFAVSEGYAGLSIGREDIDINSHEIVVVTEDKIFGPDRINFSDDFYIWNRERDRRIERSYRYSRYLPPELSDYAWELETYGSWRYVPPYGWVWVPRRVYDDWRPYYYGRWVWFPEGWFWVGYEPWGWVVYHYGRWGWSARIGWYWIPVPSWGYAWVDWTWFDGYIGWCPLDFYGRPIIIINNMVYHYYDYVPLYSSSWVFVRKDQFIARNIRHAALRKSQLRSLGVSKVKVYSTPPALKPVYAVKKTSIGYKKVIKGVSPVTGYSKTGAVRKGYTVSGKAGSTYTGRGSTITKGAVSKGSAGFRKGTKGTYTTQKKSGAVSKKSAKKKKKDTYGYMEVYPSANSKAYKNSRYYTSRSASNYYDSNYKEKSAVKKDRGGSYYTYRGGNYGYSSHKGYSYGYGEYSGYSRQRSSKRVIDYGTKSGYGKEYTGTSRENYYGYSIKKGYRSWSSSNSYSRKKGGGFIGAIKSLFSSRSSSSSRRSSSRGWSSSHKSFSFSGTSSASRSSFSSGSRGSHSSSSGSSASARKKH